MFRNAKSIMWLWLAVMSGLLVSGFSPTLGSNFMERFVSVDSFHLHLSGFLCTVLGVVDGQKAKMVGDDLASSCCHWCLGI